jgi:DNA-binding MarR family transcriptional regulator
MSPAPRKHRPNHARAAAEALLASAPLVTRWTERLLGQIEPPLSTSQYLALRAIADERITAVELAHRTGVSGPAVSQLLSTLASAGWVERHAAEADRRRQELFLSPDGQELLARIDDALIGRLGELIAQAPPPELDALTRALPFVRSALAGTPPPRRPPPPPPPHRRHDRQGPPPPPPPRGRVH